MCFLIVLFKLCVFIDFQCMCNYQHVSCIFQKCVHLVLMAVIMAGVVLWYLSKLDYKDPNAWHSAGMGDTSEMAESDPVKIHGIPKILHQTWKSYHVPEKFGNYIKSWLKHNPDWEYWFWTDVDIETLLNATFANLNPMFATFSQGIRMADALRYMTMYEFGGTYADLDMECLKPFTQLSKFNCYVSEENYEHTTLLYNRKDPVIINYVMGCRAKHPFYRDVMEALPKQSHSPRVVEQTVPLFFTGVLDQFQVRRNVDLFDHIMVLPPRYLLPMRDPRGRFVEHSCYRNFKNVSKNVWNISEFGARSLFFQNPSVKLPQEQREAELCIKLQNSNYAHEPHSEALAVHHWAHSDKGMHQLLFQRFESTIDIRELVPNLKSYTNIVTNKQTSQFYNAE